MKKDEGELLSASLREMLHNTPDFMFVKDSRYIYRASSEAFAKMAGLSSAAEVLGKTDYDIFDKSLADKYRSDDRALMETGVSITGITEHLPDVDGRERWTKTWKYVIRDKDGRIIGMYGLGKDISDFKQLEGDRSALTQILGNVPGGVAVFSEKKGVIRLDYTNEGFYRIHFGSPSYWLRQSSNPLEWLLAEDRPIFEEEFRQVRSLRRELGNAVYRVVGEDGKQHWISNQFRRAFLRDGVQFYYSSFTCVDDLKEQEQALQSVLSFENELIGQIQLLNEPLGFTRHIGELLERLGKFLDADRTYIFRLDESGETGSNTHEWCRDGVTPQKELLQRVDLRYIDRWMPFFEKRQCVVVPDIEQIRECQPDEYAIMSRQDIHSYVEAPFYFDNVFAGFIGIDNPAKDKLLHAGDTLFSLAYYVSGAILREQNSERLQRQAETLRRAKEREQNLRSVYEASVEGVELFVWEFDVQKRTVVLMDNPFTKRRSRELGIPHTVENVPESLMDKVDASNGAILRSFYADVFAGKPKTSCTLLYSPAPKHSPIALKLTYSTVCGADGQPAKAYGTAQNITKQWLTADNYRQELALFNGLVKKNLISKGHYDLTCNRVLCYHALSDKALDVDPAKTFDDAYALFSRVPIHTPDREAVRDIFSRKNLLSRFAEGRSSFSFEFPREKAKNVTTWVRIELRTFEVPDSGNLECFVYTYDNTENHLAQMLIQRMTDLGYDYIGVIDSKTRSYTFRGSRFPSQGGLRLDAHDYDASVLTAVKVHVLPEEQAAVLEAGSLEKITSELERNGSYSFSYNFLDTDGRNLRKRFQYCYLDREDGTIFFCKSDITDQYAQEQEQLCRMRDALNSAERANRAKTEFVSRISHDIRTPIGIISNMIDFAREDMGDKDKLRRDLDKIAASNTFLLSLINDVLDISKIDSGKIELNPTPYPYTEHSANVCNLLEPMCTEKGLRWEFKRRRITRGVIVADRIRLNQIVLNLLSNAVKYTPPGGTITYISDSEDLPDAKVRFGFEIRDTGIGMSKEFQKTMFEPFTQEYDNPARPKGTTGTGLGLSIVKRDVELMGGTLEVESERGKGTAFRCSIVFPDALRDPRYRSAAETHEVPLRQEAPLSGRVLLAEDNDMNTEIAVRILESFGVEAVHAENGAECVERFSRSLPGEYRAILMDIQMPVMNGYEATEKIRALPRPDAKSIPIIAMTADAFADAAERGRQAGMNKHLTKPLDPRSLREILGEAFAGRLSRN